MKKIELIAHRGLYDISLWAPENSAEAVRRAVYYGYSVEIDIQLTKDKKIVAFHDKSLMRLTGQSGNISDYTLEQLKQFRLSGTSERIPTLQEILNIVRGRVPLYIEIKIYSSPFSHIEKQLITEMKEYKGKWTAISFSFLRLWYIRKKDKCIKRGQLIPCRNDGKIRLSSILSNKTFVKFYTGLFSRPNDALYEKGCADLDTALFASEIAKRLIIWTVTSQKELNEYLKFADGIIFSGFMPE